MASSTDLVTITPAMLTPSWVKPAIPFTEGAVVNAKANSTDVYLPKLLTERAGARGGPNSAVSTDPNWTFAIAAEGPAVECDATLVAAPDPFV